MGSGAERKEMLCVGLLCLDIVNYCDKYPDEDSDNRCEQNVLCAVERWVLGGNACNNCTVLSQLGARFKLFTSIAEDHTLPLVRQRLTQLNIDSNLMVCHPGQHMSITVAIVSRKTGSRTITHAPNDLHEPTLEEFCARVDPGRFGWIHFEGRNFVEVRKMMDHVTEARGSEERPKISVEIEKTRPNIEALIPGADYVFLSKEFSKSRGFPDMISAVGGVAEKWADKKSIIICAWGEEGACARLTDGCLVRSPCFPPDRLMDTLGAGDTFVAGTLFKLDQGVSLEESIRFGCEIAGKKCGKMGLTDLNL